eukprot:jgi/Tetstr1/466095/TSEL_010679.t1
MAGNTPTGGSDGPANGGQEMVPPSEQRLRALQESVSQTVRRHSVEPAEDLRNERARATFPAEELAVYINGGSEAMDLKKRMLGLVKSGVPGWKKPQRANLSREDEHVVALQGAFHIWEKVLSRELTQEEGLMLRQLLDLPSGLELHIGMWIPTLQALGTPEQQRRWLDPSWKFQIIGTYAQTELGHGSFLRGLETTATFDAQTQSFVLHSPTLTSSKWWPGGLGKTATHAVVMARLFLSGADHGPHPFVVQLRSLEDHKPLPGIKVGDMGAKLGYNGVDNGFLRLDHVRIDRGSMLSRFSSVSPEGQYLPPPKGNEKSSYATLVFVRTTLVRDAGVALSKAVTIAIRYNAVRRQAGAREGQLETQVLDYANQYTTLLPALATAYSFRFMGQSLMDLYKQFDKDRERGDFSLLPELHQLSAGLKGICTWDAADGIEKCRYSCGGNGFLQSSGLPRLLTYYLQNVTWDGENSVMALQTARFMIKSLRTSMRGQKLTGSIAYLADHVDGSASASSTVTQPEHWADLRRLLGALERRAAVLIMLAARLLAAEEQKSGDKDAAWNACTAELIKAARAHCEVALAANFLAVLEKLARQRGVSEPVVSVVGKLAAVKSLHVLDSNIGDLLLDGYLTASQAEMLHMQFREHLQDIRPDAVALVDAFAFDDYELNNSTIGRHDGDVYKALMEQAEAAPFNATEEGPGYAVLRPRLTQHSSRL